MRYIKKIAVTSMETTGRILDSMNPEAGNPRLNAPSIKAVRQFLSQKIIDAMTSDDERHEAPSIRAVNEALAEINSDVNHFSGTETALPLTTETILTVGLERGWYIISVRAMWTSNVYFEQPQTGTYRRLSIEKNTSPWKELGCAPAPENEYTTTSATYILHLDTDTTFDFNAYHDNPHGCECTVEVDTMRLK